MKGESSLNKRKKIMLGGMLLGLALLVCTISVYASTLFTQKIGPINVVEPIEVNMLDASNVAKSVYPGHNITFRYEIKNIADKDYWIIGHIWARGEEDNQYIWTQAYAEIATLDVEFGGKASYWPGQPILIHAKTTNILTLTLEIREDSPPATGIIIYSQVTRTENPSKGIG